MELTQKNPILTRQRMELAITKVLQLAQLARATRQLPKALAAEGPISIGIDSSLISFQLYKGGIFNNLKCGNDPDSINHAVLLVGYGTENGIDYWLVKNRYV
ncbi:hypothetical protein LAZ67_1002858 [Cordylochernes scorpioides]|uniref:Peptidase C1A papain C-terminal domain-containing protein n=1 Tax=Cordylochernes scorpioides TaxID=51811 RepID=A0ABY6JWD8_9ARAC|nr:hypothetical protein LAZ67_1002858 [Cordylochernes scorpioides]